MSFVSIVSFVFKALRQPESHLAVLLFEIAEQRVNEKGEPDHLERLLDQYVSIEGEIARSVQCCVATFKKLDSDCTCAE